MECAFLGSRSKIRSEEGEQIDAVLLDFSNVFDKVPYQRLLLKLHHYVLRCLLLSWIESILTSRSQKVLVERKSSSSVPVVSSPTGLHPWPSSVPPIYINNLPVASTTRLFADDSLLYRKIKSEEDQCILQEDLQRLEEWERDWEMSFNPAKYEVIRICKRRNQLTGSCYIYGHQLANVKSGKYLGITLIDTLSWNAHVNQVTKKAYNTLSFLRRNLSSCPRQCKAQSYQTMTVQSTELPDHGLPGTGVCINSLGSLHLNQYKHVGSCPAPCFKVHDGITTQQAVYQK